MCIYYPLYFVLGVVCNVFFYLRFMTVFFVGGCSGNYLLLCLLGGWSCLSFVFIECVFVGVVRDVCCSFVICVFNDKWGIDVFIVSCPSSFLSDQLSTYIFARASEHMSRKFRLSYRLREKESKHTMLHFSKRA